MTYCVGLLLKEGLVMLSDTRTNAGVDNISTFRKMHLFEQPGERLICLMTAGNLAVTQSVVTLLTEGFEASKGEVESLYTVPSMFRAAQLVGEAVRKVWVHDGEALKQQNVGFDVSLLLGGQLKDRNLRLFLVYAAGNFVEATDDTPFLQVGETKYGKPILDRVGDPAMRLGEAAKLVLLSFDSTIRSNLSVGLPIDLAVYARDSLKIDRVRRIEREDPYFQKLSNDWGKALRRAFGDIQEFDI